MKKSIFYFTILSLVLFHSCKKDEEQNSGITITPTEDYLLRDTSDVINFTVKIESRNELAKYRVTQTINNSTITVKEETISGKTHIDWYDYTVPNSFNTYGRHEIKLIFSSFDVSGNTMNKAKIVYVDINDRTLSETSGNTMYSALSNQFNAYDLLTNTPKYNSDSTSHVFDFSTSNPSDSLGKTWISPSGIKFVKLNGFDYANATESTVKNAYNSSIKNDTIRNIAPQDVIITKVNQTYMALQLIYVIDDVGVNQDRYIFNIKK
ncbi:MAG: hypothetical protein H6586_05520 [Flavobacteriales bacterium]|nr:hypothetical protein [Flavobacteriales bacterium]